MLTKQTAAAVLLVTGMAAVSPAAAGETYQLHVEAMSLAGVPLGTQTAECSLMERCGVSFKRENEPQSIRVSVTEKAPGVLAIRADQGLDTLAVERVENERGITVELHAVRTSLTKPDEPVMTFRVTWE